jgi:hypothetical protein
MMRIQIWHREWRRSVTHVQQPDHGEHGAAADLVGYLIVAVPDRESLGSIVPALAELVDTDVIRILDLAVVARELDGTIQIDEIEAVKSMSGLDAVEGEVGSLLTEHDLQLASLALTPGAAGIVLVTEDRWAEPLSTAARRAGGRIIAGERIPRGRIRAAIEAHSEDQREEV